MPSVVIRRLQIPLPSRDFRSLRSFTLSRTARRAARRVKSFSALHFAAFTSAQRLGRSRRPRRHRRREAFLHAALHWFSAVGSEERIGRTHSSTAVLAFRVPNRICSLRANEVRPTNSPAQRGLFVALDSYVRRIAAIYVVRNPQKSCVITIAPTSIEAAALSYKRWRLFSMSQPCCIAAPSRSSSFPAALVESVIRPGIGRLYARSLGSFVVCVD